MGTLVIDGTRVERQLSPGVEARRRRLIRRLVPGLLMRHLDGRLGWRRFPFALKLVLLAPRYRRRFARPADDAGLRDVKATFLLVGALYNELASSIGEDEARSITSSFLYDLADAVQRQAYSSEQADVRTWEEFHRVHEAQMADGFIRNNENDGIHTSDLDYRLDIVRCRFYEAFRDMGAPAMTEAFCRSDEVVFNEVLPNQMRFHRGLDAANTIARGGTRCTFVFEHVTPR